MYAANGWFTLSDSAYESETSTLLTGLAQVRETLLVGSPLSSGCRVSPVNGTYVLTITVGANRPGALAQALSALLDDLGRLLPGSYGVLYAYDDERLTTPGGNAFEVSVMRKGVVTVEEDAYLSPIVPRIEDAEPTM